MSYPLLPPPPLPPTVLRPRAYPRYHGNVLALRFREQHGPGAISQCTAVAADRPGSGTGPRPNSKSTEHRPHPRLPVLPSRHPIGAACLSEAHRTHTSAWPPTAHTTRMEEGAGVQRCRLLPVEHTCCCPERSPSAALRSPGFANAHTLPPALHSHMHKIVSRVSSAHTPSSFAHTPARSTLSVDSPRRAGGVELEPVPLSRRIPHAGPDMPRA